MVLLALVVGATAACQVQVVVGVEVHGDGRGRVEAAVGLDRQALARLGDVGAELRADDLRRAGWEVLGPRREADGLTWLRARRRFATPEEAARAFADLGGPTGPFRDLRLTRQRSRFRTTTRLEATVDLTAGIEAFSDPGLAERLGGSPLGVEARELERQLGVPLDQVFRVQVTARLPGDLTANAPARAGGRAVWTPKLGERTALLAEATAWNPRPLSLAAGSAAATVALLAVLGARLVRRRRSSWPRP